MNFVVYILFLVKNKKCYFPVENYNKYNNKIYKLLPREICWYTLL